MPKYTPKLVNDTIDKGRLYDKKSYPHIDPERLKENLNALFELAGEHKTATSKHFKEQVRDRMIQIRKQYDYELLRQVLYNYIIEAVPKKYDPSRPGPPTEMESQNKRHEFIGILHEDLCDKLGIEDLDKVEFYNALDTPLDIIYSTDGFFVIKGEVFPDGHPRVFPIDITGNPEKENLDKNPSGSHILYIPSDIDDETVDKVRDEFADTISNVIRRKDGNRWDSDDFTERFGT